MLHNLPILPIELQASVADLRAVGVSEDIIEALVARMFTALSAKSNRLQVDIARIEQSLNARVDLIGDKLAGDVRTQIGSTNDMIVEILQRLDKIDHEIRDLRAQLAGRPNVEESQKLVETIWADNARITELTKQIARLSQADEAGG